MNNKTFVANIIDIELSGSTFYQKKICRITSKQIFNELSRVKYYGMGLMHDSKVENSRIPPFVSVFYKLLFDYNNLPTQERLIKGYLTYCCESPEPDENGEVTFLKKYMPNDYNLKYSYNGVRARILRAYPSLVREFHFCLLCQESGLFKNVHYSLRTDYYNGLDLRVDTEDDSYYVSVFLNTRKSNMYKGAKDNRHDYSNVKEIRIGIDLDKCDYAGDFRLCGKDKVLELKQKIDNWETVIN